LYRYTTASELRAQGPGLEAAIAAADEAAASALELCSEVRRGYDEYEGRLKRAKGALRAAAEIADAAAARHAAERKRQTDASQALLAARKRLRKAGEHRAAVQADEDVTESRRRRAADLDERAKLRKKAERARTNPKGILAAAERELRTSDLAAGEIEAIEVRFEEVDSSAMERTLAKHRRAKGAMLRRHAAEMVALGDWHRRGGGAPAHHRRRHKPGKYVDQLMEGYRVNVYRGGGDGLKPHEAEICFLTDMPDAPYTMVPPPSDSLAVLRSQRQLALGELLPEMDPGKTVRVARLEMERRHAKELTSLEARQKEAERRMVASRQSRGAKCIRNAMAETRERKKEMAAMKGAGGGSGKTTTGKKKQNGAAGAAAAVGGDYVVDGDESFDQNVEAEMDAAARLPDEFFDDAEYGYEDAAAHVAAGAGGGAAGEEAPAAAYQAWGEEV
jgi:hypothetical protein